MFYIARDKEERGGNLHIFKNKPVTSEGTGIWHNDLSSETGNRDDSVCRIPNWELPKEWFPSVTWEKGPVSCAMFRTDRLPFTEKFEKRLLKNVNEDDFPTSDKSDMYDMGMNFMFNFLSYVVDEKEEYIENMKESKNGK